MATFHRGIAQASWPSNPTVDLPLCTAANNQQYPTVVSDGAGGAIVTWYDGRSGTTDDIYAQRVSLDGAPQWTVDGVALCTAAGDQQLPSIVSDGVGGAIVTWQDNRGGNLDIYAERISMQGVAQWTADGVALCTDTGTQIYPTIVSDGAGGAIVAWSDDRSGNAHIYAQRVNGAGMVQWASNGVVLCSATNSQGFPMIALDGAGGAIITWEDGRGGNEDIYAQRVNAAGVPQWTVNGVALCTATGDQVYPAITSDGADGAIVTWIDYRGVDGDVYVQRVDAAGARQWTADGVPLSTAAHDQLYPRIASDGAGGAIVTWEDGRSGMYYDIYAQRVSTAGVPQWTADGAVLCTAANDQQLPTIMSDGAGGAIVTWNDYRGGSYDIYAQRVNATGEPQWAAAGVALCTAGGNQLNPTIVSDGAGGVIATWQDGRSGTSYDIYAQNVRANGTLGGTLLSAPPLSVAASFALRSIQPNPSFGDLSVSFSLLDGAPATLELYDLTGRRVESYSVGSLGPGAHVVSLTGRVPFLPPGVYCVCLTQGSHHAFSKVAIVR